MKLTDSVFMDLAYVLSVGEAASAGAGQNAGILNGAKCHLTKANTPTGVNASLVDLLAAEANFTGYAAKLITWAAKADINASGVIELIGTVPQWEPTDAVAPNTVYNLFVTDGAAANLLMSGDFDAPVNMMDANHQLTITLRFQPASNTTVDVIA